MGMRVTTGMAMNTYRYNLQNSTSNMTSSRNKVLSHRQFDSFAENPTSAIQAWRIRRAMKDNTSYQKNNNDTYSRFSIGWTTMGMIKTNLESAAKEAEIRARPSSTAAARVELGKILKDTGDSVIQAMNSAKYGDHFVFSGDDEMNVPFSWDGDTLLYRGVNVNAGLVPNPADPKNIPDWAKDADGNELIPANMTQDQIDAIPDKGKDSLEQAWVDYYKQTLDGKADALKPSDPPGAAWGETDEYGVPAAAKTVDETHGAYNQAWAAYYRDNGDVQRLEQMAGEHENVDLGMGLQEKDDVLINGTAFNRSLPGIEMLGYGIDEDGDPKNIVMIMKRLGEIYGNCDPDTGEFASPQDEKDADRLMNKYNDAMNRTAGAYTDVETKAHFLKENQSRLKMQGDYLQEERANLEDVDLADAITQHMWDYYCYSAALKVGTQLLSQSLIDYMN